MAKSKNPNLETSKKLLEEAVQPYKRVIALQRSILNWYLSSLEQQGDARVEELSKQLSKMSEIQEQSSKLAG